MLAPAAFIAKDVHSATLRCIPLKKTVCPRVQTQKVRMLGCAMMAVPNLDISLKLMKGKKHRPQRLLSQAATV